MMRRHNIQPPEVVPARLLIYSTIVGGCAVGAKFDPTLSAQSEAIVSSGFGIAATLMAGVAIAAQLRR